MFIPWLKAFALTQLIESPIYYGLLGRRPEPEPPLTRVALALVPSALTHPAVWFAFPTLLASWPHAAMVAMAEVFAVGVEAFVLARMGVSHAILWSLLTNAMSLSLGLLVRHFTGLV